MIGLATGTLLGMVVMAFLGLAEWERGYRAGRRSLHRPGPVAAHGEAGTRKAA